MRPNLRECAHPCFCIGGSGIGYGAVEALVGSRLRKNQLFNDLAYDSVAHSGRRKVASVLVLSIEAIEMIPDCIVSYTHAAETQAGCAP